MNGIHMGSHFAYELKFTRDLDSHEQLIHMSSNLGKLGLGFLDFFTFPTVRHASDKIQWENAAESTCARFI